MSRLRRLTIEGGALFYTVALADRGSDLLVRFGRCLPLPSLCLLRNSRSPDAAQRNPGTTCPAALAA
jgi:hypothetical protein